MSADCVNHVDQWQSLGFEERLKTTDKELSLAAEIGYNSIRIILEYAVWRSKGIPARYFPGMGPHFWLDDPMHEECYYTMIKELVTRHRDDERILIRDVYNEPVNSKPGAVTLPKLKHIFEIIREINPSQPLTAGAWLMHPEEEVLCFSRLFF